MNNFYFLRQGAPAKKPYFPEGFSNSACKVRFPGLYRKVFKDRMKSLYLYEDWETVNVFS